MDIAGTGLPVLLAGLLVKSTVVLGVDEAGRVSIG